MDNLLEGIRGDGVLLGVLEQIEGFLDVFERILLTHFDNHNFEKLLKIYSGSVKLLISLA